MNIFQAIINSFEQIWLNTSHFTSMFSKNNWYSFATLHIPFLDVSKNSQSILGVFPGCTKPCIFGFSEKSLTLTERPWFFKLKLVCKYALWSNISWHKRWEKFSFMSNHLTLIDTQPCALANLFELHVI